MYAARNTAFVVSQNEPSSGCSRSPGLYSNNMIQEQHPISAVQRLYQNHPVVEPAPMVVLLDIMKVGTRRDHAKVSFILLIMTFFAE